MDSRRFDSLARALFSTSTRRTIAGVLAGTALGGTLASLGIERASGKRKKKHKCQPCRKKKKGRCRRKKPDGTPCADDSVCQDGKCLPLLTDTCSASNDFCAQTWAHCLEMLDCGCFVTVEDDAICGNIADFTGCPAADECSVSADCESETSFCVSLPCCPEGKKACRPLCVTG